MQTEALQVSLTPSVERRQSSQVLQPLEGSGSTSTACAQEGQQSDGPTHEYAYPGDTLLGKLGEELRALILQSERVECST